MQHSERLEGTEGVKEIAHSNFLCHTQEIITLKKIVDKNHHHYLIYYFFYLLPSVYGILVSLYFQRTSEPNFPSHHLYSMSLLMNIQWIFFFFLR